MFNKVTKDCSTTTANGTPAPSVHQSSQSPRRNSLEIPVPSTSAFHLPEGIYQAQIYQIKTIYKETANGTEEWIRLLFDVRIPGRNDECMAKADYKKSLEFGLPLRNVITRLLGKAALEEAAGQNFNLDRLIGYECLIELAHDDRHNKKKYIHPLVVVRNINPLPRSQS
jgi:hypothetical protein